MAEGDVSEWFARWSEPVRVVPSNFPADLGFYVRNPLSGPYVELLNGWFRPLAEPVRFEPPLLPAHVPALFEIINFAEFRFYLTEAKDTAAFVFTVIPPGASAKVSITEVESYTASVTIKEIRYTRGYS